MNYEINYFINFWKILPNSKKSSLKKIIQLSILSSFMEIINIFALSILLNVLTNENFNNKYITLFLYNLFPKNELYKILLLSIFFALTVIISCYLRFKTISFQFRLIGEIGNYISRNVLKNILYKPYQWHKKINSINVLSSLTKDLDQTLLCIQSLLAVFCNLFTIVLIIISLLIYKPVQSLIIISVIFITYFIIYNFTRRDIKSDGEINRSNYSLSLKYAQESLKGIRDVVIDNSQEFYVGKFSEANLKSRLAEARVTVKSGSPRIFIEASVLMLFIFLALFSSLFFAKESNLISDLGTLIVGFYKILNPIQQSFIAFTSITYAIPSFIKVNKYLNDKSISKVQYPKIKFRKDLNSKFISIKSLNFRFRDKDSDILSNINLDINPGEKIAIVGMSGSGKSTLVDIILGLLNPYMGSICIYGNNLLYENINKEWAKKIGHVPQKIYFRDSSVKENIAIGKDENEINLKLLEESLKTAVIYEKIIDLPDKYDTRIGEDGSIFSGGQSQRLGIARALYKEPEVLILDEGTSALDNQTEKKLIENLLSLDDMTLLLVTHKTFTLKNFDKIVVMEKGAIKNIGTYDELMLKDDFLKNSNINV